jgi:pyruvate dehydrogenase E2 component (dihydrolipoamide acetyltransferase)
MAQPIIVPRESEEMEVCRIVRWHVARGDRVAAGELLCEVDTGKAVFDLEAPVEGTVLDIFFAEGEEAPLLTPIAVLGEEGEVYEAFRTATPGSGKPDRAGGEGVYDADPASAAVAGKPHPAAQGRGRSRTLASPRARRLAVRQGIPLRRISGSGPEGAVVEVDLRRWLRRIGRDT